jgi:hypothetical protein
MFKTKINFTVERYIYKNIINEFDLITLTISKNKIYIQYFDKIYITDLSYLTACNLLNIINNLLDIFSTENHKDLIMYNFDLSLDILDYIIKNNLLPDYEFYDYHK